jgi:small subunit ribosomal protein S16
MLKIRLSRVGKRKKPLYRVVVSENTKDMYGDHLEILGQYNPHTKDVLVKNDRVEHWLKMGAQASDSVANLLMKLGLIKADKKAKAVSVSKKRQIKIDAKKTAETAKQEAAKAAAEVAKEVVEAPAETTAEVAAEEETKTETAA